MPRDTLDFSRSPDTYFRQTHKPLNTLAFLAPLLLFFHIGTICLHKSNLLAPQDLTRLGHLLGIFGPTATYLPAILLVGTLLAMQIARREKTWRVRKAVVAGMVVESALWMLPLLGLVIFTPRVLGAGTVREPLAQGLVNAVGAGIYEEYIFRLLFVGGAILLLVKVFGLRRDAVSITAVVVSGVCFSLYHFSGQQFSLSEPFPWHDFVFRAIAGMYLGGLYLYRGYAIAVGAHAAYDIFLAMMA